jgi:hypothetical protein
VTKATRGQPVQTPGVEPEAAPVSASPETVAVGDDLPPDVQRLIDQRVAAALKADRRTREQAETNPATGANDLPTHDEALAKVKADPKHRAVLSKSGWVTFAAPPKEKDEHGFAKA